jgi:hypothetical protein
MECIHHSYKADQTLVIDIDKLSEGLSIFGYHDLPLPKSKKNFDFKKLDAKSILIMNKLSNKVIEHMEVPLK